jgi:hypothetical protein
VAACAVRARQPWKKQVGHAACRASRACCVRVQSVLRAPPRHGMAPLRRCHRGTQRRASEAARREGMGRPGGTVRQRKYGVLICSEMVRPQMYCVLRLLGTVGWGAGRGRGRRVTFLSYGAAYVLRPAGRLTGSLRVLAGHARAVDPVPVGGGGGGRIGGGRTTGPRLPGWPGGCC